MDRSCNTTRRGLTLIELLSAMMIMTMIVGTLGAMAKAVYVSSEYGQGHAATSQHARVAMHRIGRAVRGAYASGPYPGVRVIDQRVSTWRFADTLLVWRPRKTPSTPTGEPYNADGPPRFNEIVIFCPDPDEPHKLIELTAADSDTRELSPATLASDIDALKRSNSSKKVVLSDLLHTAALDSDSKQRGAVRFEVRVTPTKQQWDDFKAKKLAWGDLPWVQGVYSSKTGLRQVWVRIEMQLTPAAAAAVSEKEQLPPVPYFGSAALYYEMNKP
ncbi:MAG: prepilin-type N-terminal cleavage/methylation domain-containing protein [Planctomycetes bacterium]|nr:prepilin-type N-terminal cleavage/methylation domain-containing protein [Planctomycetota bacterium]